MAHSELYKQSGVDVAAGASFVDAIKPLVKAASRPEVIGGLGGFAGLFGLQWDKWKNPVLVSGTDGVGTKLSIAKMMRKYDTIGIDLVAMCVNDILVNGAEPLFFLDYLAVDSLERVDAVALVSGIAAACRESRCALIGGETAEMPGLYGRGDFDLAGFAVGIVERDAIIDRSNVRVGDVLIGLASSGLHSNGYSLVRKVLFTDNQLAIDAQLPDLDRPLGEVLLEPTRLYVQPVLAALRQFTIHSMVHITGGGFFENVPRSLPEGVTARVVSALWPKPPIFPFLQRMGQIPDREMFTVFNCGIGMVLSVPADQAQNIIAHFQGYQIPAWAIGEVARQAKGAGPIAIEF